MISPTPNRPDVFDPDLLADLPTPCLVVDLAAAERNIAVAAAYFRTRPQKLRPHFKAHKCTTLMKKQIAAGSCAGVTCATAWEANVLARAGFDDILVANQIADPRGLEQLARAAATAKVTACVDDPRHVDLLQRTAGRFDISLGVLIEVDVGMGRCGLPAGSEDLVQLARRVVESDRLAFRGLQGYEGHAVLEMDGDLRLSLVAEAAAILRAERARLEAAGFPSAIVSGGGTGTFDISAEAGALDEIQAGSYALMDASYAALHLPFENALFCCATVISRRDNRAVINSGLKALSAEYGMSQPVAPDLEILKLSDEHAQVTLPTSYPLGIGDTVLVVPAHIDPTVNLHSSMFVFSSGALEEWPIDGRRPPLYFDTLPSDRELHVGGLSAAEGQTKETA